mgnify:CR=1 FL=1
MCSSDLNEVMSDAAERLITIAERISSACAEPEVGDDGKARRRIGPRGPEAADAVAGVVPPDAAVPQGKQAMIQRLLSATAALLLPALASAAMPTICGDCRMEKYASCGGFLEGASVDSKGGLWVVDGKLDEAFRGVA